MATFWVFWLLHPTPSPSRSLSSEGIRCRMRLRGSLPPTGLTLHSSMALKLSRFQLFSLIIPYNSPTRRHHLHSTDARHMCGKGLLTCHVKLAVFCPFCWADSKCGMKLPFYEAKPLVHGSSVVRTSPSLVPLYSSISKHFLHWFLPSPQGSAPQFSLPAFI